MSGVATAIAGTAVVSAGVAMYEGQKARDAQEAAAAAANSTQQNEFNIQRADAAPYRAAGVQALGQIQSDPSLSKPFSMSDFQADPAYNFDMAQGQQAIERSAAARGGLNSGGTMKELTRYAQGQASNEYQNAYSRYTNDQTNRFNRLASVAGIGQTANGQLSASGTNTANQISANQIGVGNANAAANVATGNSINQGVGQGMNSWMNYTMMNRAFPQQAAPAAAPASNGGGGQMAFAE